MRKICFFIPAFLISNFVAAQDPQFAQSFAGMAYNNPAFSGSDTNGTVYMVYRNQWPKLSGNYQTTLIGWQQYIGKLNGYAGFHFSNDRAGEATLTTSRITLNYAQNFSVGKVLIRPAIEFCFFQKSLDWTQITTGDMIDPRRGFVYQSGDIPSGGDISNFDFNAGILTNFYNLSIGFSFHHLTEPNESLISGNSPLPMKIGTQIGYDLMGWIGSCTVRLQPYLTYYSQNTFSTLNAGANLMISPFLIGFNWRNKDSYAIMAGFTKFNARISYAYETTTSSLSNVNTGGTHEFALAFRIWKRRASEDYLEENKSGFDSF